MLPGITREGTRSAREEQRRTAGCLPARSPLPRQTGERLVFSHLRLLLTVGQIARSRTRGMVLHGQAAGAWLHPGPDQEAQHG